MRIKVWHCWHKNMITSNSIGLFHLIFL